MKREISEVYTGDAGQTDNHFAWKTGKEGLDNMKRVIYAKSKNDDDRKDIPSLPADIQKKINSILSVNPNIHFTIIN